MRQSYTKIGSFLYKTVKKTARKLDKGGIAVIYLHRGSDTAPGPGTNYPHTRKIGSQSVGRNHQHLLTFCRQVIDTRCLPLPLLRHAGPANSCSFLLFRNAAGAQIGDPTCSHSAARLRFLSAILYLRSYSRSCPQPYLQPCRALSVSGKRQNGTLRTPEFAEKVLLRHNRICS